MQNYRCTRFWLNHRIVLLIIFVSLCLWLLDCANTKQSPASTSAQIQHEYQNDLIEKKFVLVPVSIDALYKHRVVCANNNGFSNRTDTLVNELQTTCGIQLKKTMPINLKPPEEFQFHSTSMPDFRQQSQIQQPCRFFANETLAIIISYRDRKENLRRLLFNLIPFLNRQHIINYKIFLIEQKTVGPFNKGRLYNIGFSFVMRTFQPTCVIFHDVDLIPENEFNLYTCLTTIDQPIHMSSQVRFQPTGTYTDIYPFLVGGVLAVPPAVFRRLNGFSNRYFDWGGEDDDMGLRLLARDICVQRPVTGFYFAASHEKQKRNQRRFELLSHAVLHRNTDGLNDIDRLARIGSVTNHPLFQWVQVHWISD